ncbi:tail fiber domain-containing protein [Streptomyces sp. NPDC088768]|uniref:tail fiber domain-containing protein n=1 Tax=Streptomyces sp. NPDC088768 TaxID=3365894 RepID=UPI003826E0F1
MSSQAVADSAIGVKVEVEPLLDGSSPVDAGELLARVAVLPISTWRYTSDSRRVKHIGPMAQDMQRIFGIGNGHRLPIVDLCGLALAGLAALVRRHEALSARHLELQERVRILEGAR